LTKPLLQEISMGTSLFVSETKQHNNYKILDRAP
jgi:hypothetical protein